MTKRCFGTKEYSNKNNICKECDVRIDCEKVNPKGPKLHLKLITNEQVELLKEQNKQW